MLPSGSLQIASVGSSDEGVYRCIAVNPVSAQRVAAHNTVTLRAVQRLYHRAVYSIPIYSFTCLEGIQER